MLHLSSKKLQGSAWRSMPVTISAGLALGTSAIALLLYQHAMASTAAQRSADVRQARAAVRSVLSSESSQLSALAGSMAVHWPRESAEFAAVADDALQAPGVDRVVLIRDLSSSQRPAYEREHGPILLPAPPPPPPPALVAESSTGSHRRTHGASSAIAPPPPPLAGGAPRAGVPRGLAAGRPPQPPSERAPPQSRYLVVERSLQHEPGPPMRSVDLAADSGLRTRLLAIARGGEPGATPPVPEPTGGSATPLYAGAIYLPIYRPGAPRATGAQRLAALRGLIAGSIQYAAIGARVRQTLPAGVDFALRQGRLRLIAASGGGGGGGGDDGGPGGRDGDSSLRKPTLSSIQFAGARLTLAVGTPPPNLSVMIEEIVLGGALTLLIGSVAVQSSRRERHTLHLLEGRVQEGHRYESRLQHLAEHDPLTGLLNRRAFARAVEEHLGGGERPDEQSGALLLLDIDHFKGVNDTLGHGAGDEVIVRVADALRRRLRAEDAVARLGGDEFAILLRGGGIRDAERVAGSVLQTVKAQHAPRGAGGRQRPITASIGLVALAGHGPVTAEAAMSAADLAMYDAKEAGRDRVEAYGALLPGKGGSRRKARIEARLEWAERIRAALDEDALALLAQPVLRTASGAITQHELLIRMRDGDDGSLIAPGSFLPVAERYGLIREIDHWVISRALAMLAEQRAAGRRPVVEINLSGHSLSDESLAAHVARELRLAAIDPRQLIFEVTETAAIANIAAARRCADELGALGCRFALDDFGAGFGSFYYLKHLPFDYIKIDGEFVAECTRNATDRLVVSAVVRLAQGLGKRTVAEFVGDSETLAMVRSLGVDYAQGFHIGRPAPLEDWLAFAEGRAGRPDRETTPQGG